MSLQLKWQKRKDRYLAKAQLNVYRLFAKFTGRQLVHFLHIGKTVGTAIKSALNIKEKPRVQKDWIII
ncbi:MAG: hypothetical protein AAF705_21915, partial [Bacteroidota bacterium]